MRMCGKAGGVIHRVGVGREGEKGMRARAPRGLTYWSAESGLKGSNSSPSAYQTFSQYPPTWCSCIPMETDTRRGHLLWSPEEPEIRRVLYPNLGICLPPPPPLTLTLARWEDRRRVEIWGWAVNQVLWLWNDLEWRGSTPSLVLFYHLRARPMVRRFVRKTLRSYP